MADQRMTTAGRAAAADYRPSSAGTGPVSDADYASSAEVDEEKDWDAYTREKKLSFAASKAREAKPFAEWRAARKAKREGQGAALKALK